MKIDKRLLNALLHIVVGALLVAFKDSIVNWILTAVGAVFIINGIIQVANKKIAPGVVYIAIGVVVIVFGHQEGFDLVRQSGVHASYGVDHLQFDQSFLGQFHL